MCIYILYIYIFIIYLYNIYMFIIIYKKTHVKTSNKNGLDFSF